MNDGLVVVRAREHSREVEERAQTIETSESLDNASEEGRLQAVVVGDGDVPALRETGDNVDGDLRDDERARVAAAAGLQGVRGLAVGAGRVDGSCRDIGVNARNGGERVEKDVSLMSSMTRGGFAGFGGVNTVVTAAVASP